MNKFVISTSKSFGTNFIPADSFSRFIESQNGFKEVITRFQKYVFFPRYSRVRTLQLRDKDARAFLTENVKNIVCKSLRVHKIFTMIMMVS